MFIDIACILATYILSLLQKNEKREKILNKLCERYVVLDSSENTGTTYGEGIFGDKQAVKNVINNN